MKKARDIEQKRKDSVFWFSTYEWGLKILDSGWDFFNFYLKFEPVFLNRYNSFEHLCGLWYSKFPARFCNSLK